MPTRKRPKDADAASANSDTPTPPHAPARQPQRTGRSTGRSTRPLTAEEHAAAQAAFLQVYARTGNVSQSARRARIHRDTFYEWRDHDTAFRVRLTYADEDAQDVLRKETFRRAVVGVHEPLTNGQGLIYELEPVLGPDGEQTLDDRGRPKYRRGKIATVKKYSDGLLQTMLKARVPEYQDKRRLEITGKDGGPLQHDFSAPDPESAALARALVARITGGGAADTSGPGVSGE